MSEQPNRTEIEGSELLAAAAQAQAEVSDHQLKRWRRKGLIPRPRVVHTSGVRGSRAFYPAWTIQQLIAVARLHRRIRGLDKLLMTVWWEGHWVQTEALRSVLLKPLQQLSDEVRAVRAGADPYEAADRLMAEMKDEGPPSKAVMLMRSRLSGRADLLDLLWTFLVIALGGQAPWEQEDRSLPDQAPGALALLARALGVERAMSDDPAGHGPWLPADFDLPAFMAELRDAGGFDLEDLGNPVREASDQQLAQAREDARLLSGPLALIGTVVEGLFGEDIGGGMGSLSALEADSIFARACLVRSMLILRPLAGDAAFAAITQLVTSVHERFAVIAELRAALPQHAEILRVDYADRLAALPPAEADVVRADVAGFLSERPDLAAALAADVAA